MYDKNELREVADLLLDTAAALMGAGSHTSRVVKCVSRMAQSFGYDIFITIFQKNMTMMVRKEGQVESITLIRSTKHMALNFYVVSELSSLSWHIHDDDLTIEQARNKFNDIMERPRLPKWIVTLLVAFANSAFCGLFQGDIYSCLIVFFSTFVGFSVRQKLMGLRINHAVIFAITAMVSSFIAGQALVFGVGSTPNIAVATSVLFLIPGVPLINSLMDLMEGHVLTGFSRFINATMLIIGISIGFLATMLILGVEKF
ncbi:MAG: threonine/serine exporter family protein [Rikenellaceae bacterium]